MPKSALNRSIRRPLWWLFVAILLLKLALLAIDPQMRFFFGDSQSYLWSAESGWIPPDRSFTYPYLIRATAVATHWLPALAIAQSACGALVAVVLFHLLTVPFGLDRRIALAISLLFSVGPEQLFYERMMMAETAGTLMLTLSLLCGFQYLRRGDWRWLCGSALGGILAVSLRMNLLPVVLGFSALPVLAARFGAPDASARLPWRRVAAHALIAVVAAGLLHTGYKQWRSHEHGGMKKPDYIAYGGYFKLGLVAPLVKPDHLKGLNLPADLLSRDAFPLADPRARESQLWEANGLVDLIRKSAGDEEGNRLAGKIAKRAIRDNPLGLLRLAFLTTTDYFNANQVRLRLADDLGTRRPDEEFAAKLRKNYGFDYPASQALSSPVYAWFEIGAPWLILCLLILAPLGIATMSAGWRDARSASLLLGLASIGVVAAHALFSHIISFRYLHAFPFFVLLNVGALIALFARKRVPSGKVQSVLPAAPAP